MPFVNNIIYVCADFNFIKIFLTNAVPSYIQRIQVNTSKYLRVTQCRKNTFLIVRQLLGQASSQIFTPPQNMLRDPKHSCLNFESMEWSKIRERVICFTTQLVQERN